MVHVDRWQGRTWIQAQGNNAVAADYEMNVWTHLTLVYDDRQVCNASDAHTVQIVLMKCEPWTVALQASKKKA